MSNNSATIFKGRRTCLFCRNFYLMEFDLSLKVNRITGKHYQIFKKYLPSLSYSFLILPLCYCKLVMSGIASIDTWYQYQYRYLGIKRGIDTWNRYRDEVSKSIDSWSWYRNKVSKSIDTWKWYRNRVSKSIDTQICFRYLIFLLLNP